MNGKRGFWGGSFSGNRLMVANNLLPLAQGETKASDEMKGRGHMKRHRFEMTLGAVLLGVFLRFWSWLTPRKKLTREEIDRYLADIEKQLPLPEGEMPELLARLRDWAEADDGKPFYMLNLMRYYDQLRTFPGAPDFQGTPEESNALYEKLTTRMLLKMGGYPMVAGSTQGKNLMTYEPDLDDWSRVLLVRYPSRRTLLRLLGDPAFDQIEPYKMMALKVVLLPVSGELVIPEMRAVVGGALLSLFLAVGWIRAARGK
jgi:hypothetical protein